MSPNPRLRQDLVRREVADDLLIYDPQDGEIYLLNPTAAAIAELCDGDLDVAAIVDEIVSLTSADRSTVTDDVERTIEELGDRRLMDRG